MEPRRAVVVGAGVVGLSCAWFLQEHGIEVTVLDRSGVGAGASWGNAGYLAPAMTVPLAEPSMLREGARGVFARHSPLAVSARGLLGSLPFLVGFARNATTTSWRRGLDALSVLSASCIDAFDELAANGVAVQTARTAVRIGLPPGASTAALEHEFAAVRAAGIPAGFTTGAVAAPFSDRIGRVLVLNGQRHLDPGAFVRALADAIVARGGTIVDGARVRKVAYGPSGLQVDTWADTPFPADAVVLATGAWLPDLAGPLGVRVPVQAGRGYSCSVGIDRPLETPVYLSGIRVAVTPYRGRARLAGTMEIAAPDAPFDPRRLQAIIRSARPFLTGLDWDDVTDPWVGPRPLTPDGLPLIGATALPGVHVAGGHGMWGLTLGPITGKLLAEQIVKGQDLPQLAPFAPTRRA